MARLAIILSSIIGLTLLVTIILIACSLAVLNYNEVGLNYSNWFKTVEMKTYEKGIHFIGLGHVFQKYEISLTNIEFSSDKGATLPLIRCRTKDGLEVDLEISLQYTVDPKKIYDIYTTFGTSEKPILYRVVLDAVSDIATQYTSSDFFQKRAEIQIMMQTEVQTQVNQQTFHIVKFFQLRSLNLPDPFEDEIKNTEVKG